MRPFQGFSRREKSKENVDDVGSEKDSVLEHERALVNFTEPRRRSSSSSERSTRER